MKFIAMRGLNIYSREHIGISIRFFKDAILLM